MKKYLFVLVGLASGFALCLNADAQWLSESFEAGLSAWTTTGSWAINAENAATDTPSNNYANNSDSALTLAAPLDFSSAVNPALLFTHRYAIEPVYDAATVEISTNGGGSWTELARYSGNRLAWSRRQIALAAFAGEPSVLLRFRLQTDSSVVYDGWYIADVLIDELPGQAVITNTTAQGFSSVLVEWSAPSGATIQSYQLYRSMISGAAPEDSLMIGSTESGTLSFTDFSIAPKNTFYYRVVSIDTAGLSSVSDESSITLPAGMDFPFLDSGEAGPTHWQAGGDWALAADPGNPANTCWTDSPGAPYANSLNAAITLTAPLNLSTATNPVLAFKHKYDLLTGDILSAEVSTTDGAEWTSLKSYTAGTFTNQWTQENLSLAPYIGANQVLIRFLLTTTISGTAEGCWLDNIAVAEAPSPVSTLLIDNIQSHSVRLTWPQNTDTLFSHYAVYRKAGTSGVDFRNDLVAEITDQTQHQYTDTGLLLNSDYVYRVYSVSSYGTLSTVTAERSVLTENHPVPFIDDFEGSSEGWILAGSWNLETDGTNSWLSDSPGSFYSNNQRDTDNYALTSVDLTGTTWPVLSFRDRFNLSGNDCGYLQISRDGVNWYSRYTVTGLRSQWTDQQIDLSEWAGEPNLRLRFHLYSDGATINDGWQIDDIAVQEYLPPAAQSLPILERFEAGASNWINGGWAATTNTAYEGAAAMQSPPVPLTPTYVDACTSFGRELNLAGSTAPQITLWAKGIDDGICQLYLELSSNGGKNWTQISGDIDTKPGFWKRFQFAVPPAFKVDGLRLRLRAFTYYDVRATEFYIDKLTIEESPTWVTLTTPVPHLKSIDLDWGTFVNASTFRKYELYRREAAGVSMADTLLMSTTNLTQTSFTDSGLSIGRTYYYRVYVYNLNDTATPSNEAQATTVPVTLPISDTLADLALWDILGSWGIETNSAGAWLSDSPDRPYENNQNETKNYALTAVNLTGTTWPVLSFRDRFNLTGNDCGYLQISRDGVNWYSRYTVTGLRTEWTDQQIDLSEWAGEPNLRLRFHLYSDGATTADGWQIDDFAVQEHLPPAALSLPILERFETGVSNWINGGWAATTNTAYEGAAAMQSPPVPLTPTYVDACTSFGRELNLAGSTVPQITLWAKGIDDGICQLYLELSSNGGKNWTQISGDIDTKPGFWKRFQFAVPPAFKVDGLRLRLRAFTYYDVRATEFYIDKLTIEESPTWVTLTTPVPHLKSIDLDWGTFVNASTFRKYELYRRAAAGVSITDTLLMSTTNITETSFTDSGLSIGRTYYYRVYVYNLNDTATPSNEAQATTVPVTLPISDTLADLALWDILGSWGIETNSAGAWLSDSPDRPYENNQNETKNYALTAVNLTGTTWPVLSFRDRFNLTGNDCGYLQISRDGVNWYSRYTVTGLRSQWTDQQIDLSEWAGEPNLRLRFHLYSDGATTADGWQIDDFAVQEHLPPAAQSLPILERFETGVSNWINGGWAATTNTAYEGAAAMQSPPVPLTPTYVDACASFSRELNLAGSTAPQITLWAKGIDDGICQLYCELSSNGGKNWTQISGDIDTKPGFWKRFQFAVPPAFKVDGLRLRLRAFTYYDVRATEFYIDKLTIEESPTWVTLTTPVPHLKSIDLEWGTFGSASTFRKYELYRREAAGVSMADTLLMSTTNIAETSFTDSGLSIGRTYYYRVYVYNLNDTATPSNEAQATTVPLTLPISDALDNLVQWDILGSWGIETNSVDAWLSDSPDRPYENNQNETKNYARTAVNLTGTTWPVLSFRDRFSLTGNDCGYLQISRDGVNWYSRYTVTGPRSQWTAQQIDLSEWAGEPNLRLRFYLYSDGATTADGWQIDDFAVQEYIPPAAQSLPLLERFETGVSSWINGGWALATNEFYEGSAAMQSPPVPLTPTYVDACASFGRELNLAGSTAPQITLWAKGIDDGICQLYCELSGNGGKNWTQISGDIDTKPGFWKRFQFAVPPAFKVDGLRLRLRAFTYYDVRATRFYIDRIAIGEVTPGTPLPLSPADGSVVNILHPTLTVINSVDILDDNSSYEFEVYTNASLEVSSLVTRLPVLAAGDETTSWQIDVQMIDGLQYWWRSRATSSSGHLSAWSATNTFHMVLVNHPPSLPYILSPYANATLPDASGSFIWMGSTDTDATDYVAEYQLEIAADSTFSNVLLSAVINEQAPVGVIALNAISGYASLPLNQTYFWRIRAVDSLGLSSEWVMEPFLYGELITEPPVIEPVTITKSSMNGNLLRLEWTPTEQVVWIEFSPTLAPAQWVPVNGTLNIKTNYFELSVPDNQPQGFFRVMIAD